MSATKDIEMADATSKPENNSTEVANLIVADLKKNIALLEKSVSSKDIRLVSRVLRGLSLIRRRITPSVLRKVINQTFTSDADQNKKLNLLNSFQHISDSSTETDSAMEFVSNANSIIPEVEVYLHLLVIIFLIDKKSFQQAVSLSSNLVERIQEFNRRTMNPLSAKAYFYYSRSYEAIGKLEEIRANLLGFLRTASLKHNEESQATLLNLLLRNYLAYNLYDQAEKLISKIQFREDTANSNEHARYLYYQGRIKSVQLEYTDAYRCLLGAMRKAPQNSARGFRLAVNKLACIVQCLIGEIPERSMFRQPDLRKGLVPYLQLTQAVRVGDLAAFHRVINQHGETFKTDKTFTLIQRLRHNVIKTGLRKINLSYSRISFEDICTKLHLESVEDAEFIVAKAIRDGVINATIDHAGRFIQSKEQTDVYSTQEPQAAFHRRIVFCLNTHNEAVKAMRFPPDAHKPSLESAKERREREQEIAKNLAEEDEYD